MTFRVLIVACVTLLCSLALSADCVNCPNSSCMIIYSNGDSRVVNDTPICGYEAASDKGYQDCRNVDCRGCIGWTCVTRDPEVMQKERLLKLLSTEIIRDPARTKSKR
jgi:hypothetical protein